ncbi:MAG: Hsp20/alpha crystallin family protein [Myxococcota bacterium]|nr:Hsp20/alpha crystallin family protein [Myxococcota bacterium]
MAEAKEGRSLGRWDPFGEPDVFRGWDPFGDRLLRLGRLFGETEPRERALVPPVEIAEDDEKYVLTMEIPGASRDQVTVETHDNVLTVRGEKRSEREEKKEHSRYVERRYGSFSRSFTLPANANPNQVTARFDAGVLTVELPKAEEPKPRSVAIKS